MAGIIGRWRGAWLPPLSTALLYAASYLIASKLFSVSLYRSGLVWDYALQLLLAYALYALSRRVWMFLLIQTLLFGVLYVGNAAKLSFFGGPIMPDDVYALRSLLLLLEGWQFLAAALPLAAILGLLVFNVTLRHRGAYLAFVALATAGLTLVYQPRLILEPLDAHLGHSVWDQRTNYLSRGAGIYTLQEGARYFADADVVPDRHQVERAVAALAERLPVTPVAATGAPPRNLHMIVLESFWDPLLLSAAGYDQDPLGEAFRTLWKATGQSTVMSPVFGGYTANAEFEALCGYPVVRDSVKFERHLANDVPCLPRVLAEAGYDTSASHPNVPVFWNRVNAYRRLGFRRYWALQDFVQDDMNREFMADSTLYRQVSDKLAAGVAAGRPQFNYVLTYFGHWDYPLGPARTPQVASRSAVAEVGTYANTVYYKARELLAYLQRLRSDDPDALIAVFGDHLPYLGGNFAGYAESGVLATARSDFTDAMFPLYVSTPLIVIDGQRGPQRLGNIAMYRLPALLLGMLGQPVPPALAYAATAPGMEVRPLPGVHFNRLPDGGVEVCRPEGGGPSCAASEAWLQHLLTISNDLFVGRQHVLGTAAR